MAVETGPIPASFERNPLPFPPIAAFLPPPPVGDDGPSVSFEFFPPKTAAAEAQLWQTIGRVAPVGPAFVSVTYGAGGSTREHTHNTVLRIRRDTALEPAAHLTCVGASRTEIDETAWRYWVGGVRHIVALRGDPPVDGAGYAPHPDGYDHAADLVAGLSRVAPFEISVAAFPEVHPEARSREADLDNLKRKIDAGANRAITQFFFDPTTYLRFRDRARAAGITVPIVPGILPVTDFVQMTKFAARCGTSVPSWLAEQFAGLEYDPDMRRLVGAAVAAELCRVLQSRGVGEFHFYTLNRAELSLAICRMIGARKRAVSAVTAP
jgi:methylenetetrahydrofolate reductase (NADPH)